jgi:hypothetical protein
MSWRALEMKTILNSLARLLMIVSLIPYGCGAGGGGDSGNGSNANENSNSPPAQSLSGAESRMNQDFTTMADLIGVLPDRNQ